MVEFDYLYRFDDITDRRSLGKKTDLRMGVTQPILVRVDDAALRYYAMPLAPILSPGISRGMLHSSCDACNRLQSISSKCRWR